MKINFVTSVQPCSGKIAFKGNKYLSLADNFSTLDKFTENATLKFKRYIPVLKDFINTTGKYKDTNFRSVVGQGGYSIVFDIGNNEVLKLTKENPYLFRKYIKGLDVPLLDFDEYKGVYILKETKAVVDRKTTKPEHYTEILKIMRKHRLEPSVDFAEYRTEQIGLIGDKPYLLDSRCAVPKPNKFTEFVENFSETHRKRKLTLRPNDMNETEFGHVDETPRANLTFRQGVKKLASTILDNIEFYTLLILNKRNDKFVI